MVDRLDPERRSRLMRQVQGKDTLPEKVVRSLVHRLGYRFRLHRRDLPGTPDLVFRGRRAALLVHGCFWHGHGCRIGRLPKSKLDYWGPKIAANQARDARKQAELDAAGWRSAVVWQCELADPARLAKRLRALLDPPQKFRSTKRSFSNSPPVPPEKPRAFLAQTGPTPPFVRRYWRPTGGYMPGSDRSSMLWTIKPVLESVGIGERSRFAEELQLSLAVSV